MNRAKRLMRPVMLWREQAVALAPVPGDLAVEEDLVEEEDHRPRRHHRSRSKTGEMKTLRHGQVATMMSTRPYPQNADY